MTRSPKPPKTQNSIILDGRAGPKGSKWDEKIHTPTGLTYYDLRYKVGEAVVRGGISYSDAVSIFTVSKPFVSKWVRVFRAREEANTRGRVRRNRVSKKVFRSLSNRPRNQASPVQDRIREAVIERRKAMEFEGAFRIRAYLQRKGLSASPTTINKVMRSAGLMDIPKKRHVDKVYGRFQRPWAMELVQIDFKTWADGIHTIWAIDDCTRRILASRVVASTSADVVIDMLEEVIDSFGVPKQILSDHGTEFYSVRGGKGKSRLDRWCKAQGSEHIMGRVRHPQTQGKMERSHRSAKEEILTFGSLDSLEEAQLTFSRWIAYYNWDRPHQALNYQTPGAVFDGMIGVDLEAISA